MPRPEEFAPGPQTPGTFFYNLAKGLRELILWRFNPTKFNPIAFERFGIEQLMRLASVLGPGIERAITDDYMAGHTVTDLERQEYKRKFGVAPPTRQQYLERIDILTQGGQRQLPPWTKLLGEDFWAGLHNAPPPFRPPEVESIEKQRQKALQNLLENVRYDEIDWDKIDVVGTVRKAPFADNIVAGRVAPTDENGIRLLWWKYIGREMSDDEFAQIYLNLNGAGQVRVLSETEWQTFGEGLESKYGSYLSSWKTALAAGKIPVGMPPELLAQYLIPQRQRDFIAFYQRGNLTDMSDILSLKKDWEEVIYGYTTQFDFAVGDLLKSNALFQAAVNAYEEASAKIAAGWRLGIFLPPLDFRSFLQEGILLDTILQSERELKNATWKSQQKAQQDMAKIQEAKSEAEAAANRKLGAAALAKIEADAFQAEKVGDVEAATSIRRILAARQYLLSFLPEDQALNMARDFGRVSPLETFTEYSARIKKLIESIKGLATKMGGVSGDTVIPDLESFGAIDPMLDAPFVVGSSKAPKLPGGTEPFPMLTPQRIDELNREAQAIKGKQLAWQKEGPPTEEFDVALRQFVGTLPVGEQISAYRLLAEQGLPILQLRFEQEWAKRSEQPEAKAPTVYDKSVALKTTEQEMAIWFEENPTAPPEMKTQVEKFFAEKQAEIAKQPSLEDVNVQQAAAFRQQVAQGGLSEARRQQFPGQRVAGQGFTALTYAWRDLLRGTDLSALYGELTAKTEKQTQKEAQQMAQLQGRQFFPIVRY